MMVQLGSMIQQKQQVQESYKQEIITNLDPVSSVISKSREKKVKAEGLFLNQLKEIREKQKKNMAALISQLDEMTRQQQKEAISNKKQLIQKMSLVKTETRSKNQRTIEKQNISQKERNAIMASIALANQSIHEKYGKEKLLLQHTKKHHDSRKKERMLTNASIESLRIMVLENQAENSKAMKALKKKLT